MAVSDAYTDAATYRAIVSKSDTGEDAEILSDLKAISRYIDRKCGRFFGKDAAVVARVFVVPSAPIAPGYLDPWGYAYAARELVVDDIATSAGLLIKTDTDADGTFDETAWASTDYLLSPENAPYGPEPSPYTRISVPTWSLQSAFGAGQRIQVTALWGWPAVPDAIVRATAHLTGILRLESPRATSRVNEMGEVLSTSREAQNIIKELVSVYARRWVLV